MKLLLFFSGAMFGGGAARFLMADAASYSGVPSMALGLIMAIYILAKDSK